MSFYHSQHLVRSPLKLFAVAADTAHNSFGFNLLEKRLSISIRFVFFTVLCFSTLFNLSKAQETEEQSKSKSFNRSDIKVDPPVNANTQNQNDIKHYLDPNIIESMLIGPNEQLTLVTKNRTANEKGTAILIPDWHSSAASPKAINYLRSTLPDEGWTTITLQPLDAPEYPENTQTVDIKTTQTNTENPSSDTQTLNKETPPEDQNLENSDSTAKASLNNYQIKLKTVYEAVLEKAKESPGIILVIAKGQNAAQLQAILSDNSIEKPNVLILLSAYMPSYKQSEKFAKQLSESSVSTLDLYLTNDHPKVSESAALRKQLAE